MFVFYFGITEMTQIVIAFFFPQKKKKGAGGTLSERALCVVEPSQ